MEITCGMNLRESLNIFKGKDVRDTAEDDLQIQPCLLWGLQEFCASLSGISSLQGSEDVVRMKGHRHSE